MRKAPNVLAQYEYVCISDGKKQATKAEQLQLSETAVSLLIDRTFAAGVGASAVWQCMDRGALSRRCRLA